MKKSWLWCGAIACTAFLLYLGSTGLVDETEPLFAEAARDMLVRGDWITPYYNGETRFDKPPLVYWGMIIAYKIVGVNTWGVRLPSALGAIALVFLSFYTVLRFEKKAAWLVAGILSFNMYSLIWGRTGVSDMLLSANIGCSLLCFFCAYSQGEKQETTTGLWGFPSLWYLLFYICSGLAVLAKGPVGLVLPGLVVLGFLVYVGKWKTLIEEMGIIWGIVIFLVVTVPWYVLVIWKNGTEYIDTFFGYHNIQRFTGVVSGHDGSWYYYFPVLFLLFIPWSIYLPVAIADTQFWRRRFWSKQPRSKQLAIFAFFWLAIIFIFFNIAVTRLPSYLLPLVPAATILVSLYWSEVKQSKPLLISIMINIIVTFIFSILFWYLPQIIGDDPAILNLPEVINKSGLPWRGSLIWLSCTGFLIFLITQRKRFSWIIWTNLVAFICMFLFVLIPGVFLIDLERQVPVREIAKTIVEVKQPGEEIVMLAFKKPSLVFYTENKISFLKSQDDFEDYLETSNENPNIANTLLIIIYENKLDDFHLTDRNYELITQQPPYLLLRVERSEFL